jgi:parallel beta-helix repeat protein
MIPNRKAIIEMTLGLLVIAGTVQAGSTVINTCPVVIDSPGRYVLGADLICGGGDGITINSNDVTLALEGHRITAGERANRAIVADALPIAPTFQNVHILGPGLITNGGGNTFSVGVFLDFLLNSEVRGITVLGSSGNGIVSADCTSLTVTANTLGRNSIGLALGDPHENTISENDISGNGTGIFLVGNSGVATATLSRNVLNGNTGAGLSIGEIFVATVQNNVINGNGQYGIFVQPAPPPGGSVNLEVTNNTSLANGMVDLFDGSRRH